MQRSVPGARPGPGDGESSDGRSSPRKAPRGSLLWKGLLLLVAPWVAQAALLLSIGRNQAAEGGLLLAVAGGTAAGLLLAGLFLRSLGSRLEVVAANARRIVDGPALAPPLDGTDEIAELDRSLHRMAAWLAETVAAARRHEAEVEQNADQLAAINQDLLFKTEEIETFVYSVSHDLRSPLVNLQGFSRELERSCADLRGVLSPLALAPEVRGRLEVVDRDIGEAVHFIKTAVSSSERIIDALLRLSRAGRVIYQWQLVDVAEVVHNAVDAMRATISEKRAQVVIGPLPQAWGDPTVVEQIFSNLLKNAVSYLDPGRPGRIEVGGRSGAPGEPITYWVRDNGVGIPAAYQGRVFVAFQRFRSDMASGEGVGLALVRRAVERHEGQIRLESTDGVGTTFFLTLRGEAGGRYTPRQGLPIPVLAKGEHP
jgi:signal transduction histidine kinase